MQQLGGRKASALSILIDTPQSGGLASLPRLPSAPPPSSSILFSVLFQTALGFSISFRKYIQPPGLLVWNVVTHNFIIWKNGAESLCPFGKQKKNNSRKKSSCDFHTRDSAIQHPSFKSLIHCVTWWRTLFLELVYIWILHGRPIDGSQWITPRLYMHIYSVLDNSHSVLVLFSSFLQPNTFTARLYTAWIVNISSKEMKDDVMCSVVAANVNCDR